MELWQEIFLIIFGFLNAVIFVLAYCQYFLKRNPFGLCNLVLLGSFVWGDAIIFSVFWIMVSLIAYLLSDWLLFLLVVSLFWVVRSVGETFYWMLQQFSPIIRDKPESLFIHKLFKSDAVWFIQQILWQCVTVISLVCSIYYGRLWLQSL